MTEAAHKRYNPLLDEWVLVSPHRTKRPWQGQQESEDTEVAAGYDANCYLCPGNTRAEGAVNPDYGDTFVFDNDFAALQQDEQVLESEHPLLRQKAENGICRVVCYSPNHSLSMARLSVDQIEKVVVAWIEEYNKLGQLDTIDYVQIFENRGAAMGCSNPHPHGQIWATGSIPNIPAKELTQQARYKEENGSCLLCDYISLELEQKKRIVFENESFAALVPYWATWPYELMVLPKHHVGAISELGKTEQRDLAEALKTVGVIYDNLFKTSFPYSMGLHQTPTNGGKYPENHFHIHYYPPLLRSATVKKFMVGFEMMAMPQRDLTAEGAADILNGLSRIHYLEGVEKE